MADTSEQACPLARCPELDGSLERLLSREWLITNGRGGFASGTVIGAATRRYHGLLCAARRPPLERFMLLAATLDRVTVNGAAVELSTYEFNHAFHPQGFRLLTDFAYNLDPPRPWAAFTYVIAAGSLQSDGRPDPGRTVTAVKRVELATGEDRVVLRYEVRGADAAADVRLDVLPMLSMRDYHMLRRQSAVEPWDLAVERAAVCVRDRQDLERTLQLTGRCENQTGALRYEHAPVWWHNFRYREEQARGFPFGEDLLCAGAFVAEGKGALRVEVEAVAFSRESSGFPPPAAAGRQGSHVPAGGLARQSPRQHAISGAGATTSADGAGSPDPVTRRLSAAADQFVVARRYADGAHGATILAGYHWFGDWGRDAFISLEGLLLARKRFDEARQVLLTFAGTQRDGLIANRFSDYGEECEYNSVDASLWFIHAADAYLSATGDERAWSEGLAEACRNVIEAFVNGTRYGIRADDAGLITCGDPTTQITWMDAKVGDHVCTPRHGRPVEVNALWYHALCILARRCRGTGAARQYEQLAARVRKGFAETFWNEHEQCLCDVVRDDEKDLAVRPNQILAVGLADSPLTDKQAAQVLDTVTRHLLTPYGLRSLSNQDSRYIGRYAGHSYDHDRAYHNGTVWAWLMGPYIDAYLRVNGATPAAKREGLALLQPLIDHLDEAGLGSVSEIFDGDPPHTPRGCIAQAWSVAEVSRAYARLALSD